MPRPIAGPLSGIFSFPLLTGYGDRNSNRNKRTRIEIGFLRIRKLRQILSSRRIFVFVCLTSIGVLISLSVRNENKLSLPVFHQTWSHGKTQSLKESHVTSSNQSAVHSFTGSNVNVSSETTEPNFITSTRTQTTLVKKGFPRRNSSFAIQLQRLRLKARYHADLTQRGNGTARDLDIAHFNPRDWLLYWRPLMSGRGVSSQVMTSSFGEDTDLMKEGPFEFLPQYKNPCWFRNDQQRSLYCLPYFYLIGAPKAGTTDIYSRLCAHPEFAATAWKEPHWLTRVRHYRGSWGNPAAHLSFYLSRVFSRAASKIFRATLGKPDMYNRIITGDCSASTMFDNDYWPILAENRGKDEPLHTNADYIHHLNPSTKIIAILRNPIERLYSDFLYFEKSAARKTKQSFHDRVVEALRVLRLCLQVRTIRSCVSDFTLEPVMPRLRLRIGIYVTFLEEFFRVFPRNQILVLRLEDHAVDPLYSMERIFDFLGMSQPPESKIAVIGDATRRANTRHYSDRKTGSMLPETRDLLYEFYKPYNEQLADLLGDQSFNYGPE